MSFFDQILLNSHPEGLPLQPEAPEHGHHPRAMCYPGDNHQLQQPASSSQAVGKPDSLCVVKVKLCIPNDGRWHLGQYLVSSMAGEQEGIRPHRVNLWSTNQLPYSSHPISLPSLVLGHACLVTELVAAHHGYDGHCQ